MTRRIEIYDTTLRDGTQGLGVSLSLVDKLKIAQHLDGLGVDFIEGGYPLSNPKDVAFFQEIRRRPMAHARVCAFGMTRRKGVAAADDPGMQALVQAQAPVITIVGKTWDLHVTGVLNVTLEENLDMIRESLAFCASHAAVFYDAEHFFDGYRANPDYALSTLRAAMAGGASRLVLCDTNGGSLPGFVASVTQQVQQALGTEARLGIHPHNDSGLAVANALAAVENGAVQVQGTINGIGERCGNVDLITVVANLQLKMNLACLRPDALTHLTAASRYVYEIANLNLVPGQPYVGVGAFAHKGGMHVHAVRKFAHSYEHIDPAKVGNARRVLVSELSGISNVTATVGERFKNADLATQRRLLARVAELENQGYQFESAMASFELLLRGLMDQRPAFWGLDHYRCVILKRGDEPAGTEAIVKLRVGEQQEHHVAEGDGPVNALDGALRKCLLPHYPALSRVHLRDFKVRVVNATAESAAKVRVIIDFAVLTPTDEGHAPAAECHGVEAGATEGRHFSTIGVSENVVDAAWQAIADAFTFHLLAETSANPHAAPGSATSPTGASA